LEKKFTKKVIGAFAFGSFILVFQCASFAQCKEKQSESSNQTIHYQTIPLNGESEYLTLSSQGEEKLFSYSNEKIDLVFHVQMFTEVKITTTKGNFSLFATTSNRTRWKRCFILLAPLTAREIEQMKGVTKIEIMLPEDRKVFSLNTKKTDKFDQALACLF
jgi:hypothetical protein